MPANESKHHESRLGVLLFNLGGPETLDEVRPFLYNLFSDPDIIRIKNNGLRKLVAWMIATTRQRKSRDLYRQIGGGSPLRRITEQQAEALAERLRARGISVKAYVGMRCWRPTIDDAMDTIRQDAVTRLIALPLFPQFSYTTTGSCFGYFRSIVGRNGDAAPHLEVTYIESWHDDPGYIKSMANLIRDSFDSFPDPDPRRVHLLYTAHSIPTRYVDEGDPYLRQTRETVALVNTELGNVSPWTLAFQSRVGPVKWLEPATKDVLSELARGGVGQVLAVPISFVSDHIETLQEIDILYRDIARQSGIREFRRVPALNTSPEFIEALAAIVSAALGR